MSTRTAAPFTLEREAPGLVGPSDSTADGTSRARDPRRLRRRRRTLVAAAIGLLAVALTLVAIAAGGSSGGYLDPRSADPTGVRALAELLRGRGVAVDRSTAAGPRRTVVVPFVADLDDADLDRLLRSGSDVVLIDPGPVAAAQLSTVTSRPVSTRSPGCAFGPAQVAGPARMGGTVYATTATVDAVSCYDATLLIVPAGTVSTGPVATTSGRLIVLASPGFLTNAHLAAQGNAALALGILSDQPRLTWYTARRTAGDTTLTDLLPGAVGWAILQIGIAVVLVAVWRGRRLGPVVTEPLPVIVRAGETVMGRARLYAAARARSTAAAALREGSRARLIVLLHLDSSAPPQALVASVAARVTPDATAVAGILYGTPGGDGYVAADAALVRLAADLDRLEREVARV